MSFLRPTFLLLATAATTRSMSVMSRWKRWWVRVNKSIKSERHSEREGAAACDVLLLSLNLNRGLRFGSVGLLSSSLLGKKHYSYIIIIMVVRFLAPQAHMSKLCCLMRSTFQNREGKRQTNKQVFTLIFLHHQIWDLLSCTLSLYHAASPVYSNVGG